MFYQIYLVQMLIDSTFANPMNPYLMFWGGAEPADTLKLKIRQAAQLPPAMVRHKVTKTGK
ncbi:hypothetical protein C7N43_20655 [Sphingobacteriales bacterium UPWRP_1]|nr:hypothetical protein BVG80_01930 [Sphingobacteriales bacterium TSM_CSM]PSJ75118.1 hypothetical protein C7N43_20655 [Sphingobacteriales bacterium UPWRP_1]